MAKTMFDWAILIALIIIAIVETIKGDLLLCSLCWAIVSMKCDIMLLSKKEQSQQQRAKPQSDMTEQAKRLVSLSDEEAKEVVSITDKVLKESSHEGVAWGAPGFEAPGRPGPND